MKRSAIIALCWCVVGSPAMAQTPAAKSDFDDRVAPILVRRCLDCHSGPERKGGLDLSRRESAMRGGKNGEAIRPGEPDESLLWQNVSEGTMPPKAKLPEEEQEILRRWIADGAPWGSDPIDPYRATTDRRGGRDWWAYQPVKRPDIPVIGAGKTVVNPIDAFVLHKLDAEGLSSSSPADRRTLIRRLSFDLLGLPPAAGEIEVFVADDRPDAFERLVDHYLASPEYGVRWARLWLDLARYGESNGFEHDEFRPNSWRYRDWVVNALNRDLPYDEFARRQIAGDVLHSDDPEAIEATGFLVAGAYDSVGQTQQSEAMRKVVRQDELEDVIGTVSQAFLGLTVHCARCHDHKFDPIRQVEYYQFASALSGVRHGERDLSAIDPAARSARDELAALQARREALEAPARKRLLGERSEAGIVPPSPIASWDFEGDGEDRVGGLNVATAATGQGGLKVGRDGGYAATLPLKSDLRAKTLEVWVRLNVLAQSGGAAIGVQALDGSVFDAIVFGEREAGRWMAGSNGFSRYQSFGGPAEAEATTRPVHLAISFAEDGTIAAYRDGQPYGSPYRTTPPPTFAAGKAQVLFGLRHSPESPQKILSGRVLRARLYDRALSAEEIQASAGRAISERELDAALTSEERSHRSRLIAQISSLRTRLSGEVRRAYAVQPREPDPTHLLVRGDTRQAREIVSPGGLAVLADLNADLGLPGDAPEAERRRRLAHWLTDRRNPLFARVIVNRLWQGHFGTGLVETPSDFGFNGGHPSHPELLDWLASELMDRGWSLKALHRLIVTSATYRQASHPNPQALSKDASDRLLWRKAPLRLEAEMVRDAMLSLAGALQNHPGGPGFREFAVSRAEGTITNQYKPVAAEGPDFDRRTLYRTWARGGRNPFLDAFDCPDPSTTAPRRASTTTPLQALALLNNASTLRLADRFADRLRLEAGEDADRQVARAYALAFGRAPTEEERREARAVVGKHGLPILSRAIFNSNEFLYID